MAFFVFNTVNLNIYVKLHDFFVFMVLPYFLVQ